MEEAWGAKVYDHAGATEIGAWGYECTAQSGGIHINEALFLAELEDLARGVVGEMEGVADFAVPLRVDWGRGENWLEAH